MRNQQNILLIASITCLQDHTKEFRYNDVYIIMLWNGCKFISSYFTQFSDKFNLKNKVEQFKSNIQGNPK